MNGSIPYEIRLGIDVTMDGVPEELRTEENASEIIDSIADIIQEELAQYVNIRLLTIHTKRLEEFK